MAMWFKPPMGVYKLNTRGIFNRELMRSSVGGVLRDHNGNWTRGVGGMIGLAVSNHAELWSIFYGLKLAWEKDITALIVESQSADALDSILHPSPAFELAGLVKWINDIRAEAWDTLVFVHVEPTSNILANALADVEIGSAGGISEYESCPEAIMPILLNEM